MRIDRKRIPVNERPPIGFAIYKVTVVKATVLWKNSVVILNLTFVRSLYTGQLSIFLSRLQEETDLRRQRHLSQHLLSHVERC